MERHFDQLLGELKASFLRMGAAVEESIEQAVRSLVGRDNGLATEVIKGGEAIDRWEVEIEEQCLTLMATQHPVASDLRLLAALVKVNYDLERCNDQAVNIAQRALVLNSLPLLKPLIDIPRMGELTRKMVKDALDALVHKDAALARQVCALDEQVDLLRDQIFRELLTYMHATSQPDTVDRGVYLILVSRHLERIGDHASNIAENAIYLVESRIVRHLKEKH
jgi:phosphate transport system protein